MRPAFSTASDAKFHVPTATHGPWRASTDETAAEIPGKEETERMNSKKREEAVGRKGDAAGADGDGLGWSGMARSRLSEMASPST